METYETYIEQDDECLGIVVDFTWGYYDPDWDDCPEIILDEVYSGLTGEPVALTDEDLEKLLDEIEENKGVTSHGSISLPCQCGRNACKYTNPLSGKYWVRCNHCGRNTPVVYGGHVAADLWAEKVFQSDNSTANPDAA